MARYANPLMLDAALNYVADNGSRIDVCAGEPATYAAATTTNSLASFTGLTTGAGNGVYTLAAGDGAAGSRKVTVAAQTGASIGTSGTADHLAITNGVDTLLYVTTVTSQAITSGGTVDTSAWDIEISNPTA